MAASRVLKCVNRDNDQTRGPVMADRQDILEYYVIMSDLLDELRVSQK